MPLLIPLFFAAALLYSSVGFGGGSTYSALLVLAGMDYRAIPVLSLACNILVVIVGSSRFAKDGHFAWRRLWPLFALSVPMAWLGGGLVVPERTFLGLLALALLASGAAMLWKPESKDPAPHRRTRIWCEAMIGGCIGFLAGIVGIGGGIFLAPILHLLRWGSPKAIAGTCAAFILVNSVAGLIGQLAKDDGFDRGQALAASWFLFPAVILGGLLGSAIGSGRLRPAHVRTATAILVLYAAVQLGFRFHELGSGGVA